MTNSSTIKFIKHAAKRITTLLVTSSVLVLAGAAVWQGNMIISDRASAVAKPNPTEPLLVETDYISIEESYEFSRSFTGQLEALQSAELSFERGGTLASVFYDEGDDVQKGDIVARLDDRLLKAEVTRIEAGKRALQAQLELAKATNNRQIELQKKGFATAQTTDESGFLIAELTARLAELEASLVAANINLEKADIRAPFGGRISDRLLDPGSTVGAGQAVVSILEDSNPVFRVGIDPDLAEKLKVGDALKVKLGAISAPASIVAVLPQLDAGTRTRIVRARLDTNSDLPLGTTGSVMLLQNSDDAGAWVPLTALEDGIRGLWTIKTVQDDEQTQTVKKVKLATVEIIYSDEYRAFVRGTFADGDRYIIKGVHRIAQGQTVRVENEQ